MSKQNYTRGPNRPAHCGRHSMFGLRPAKGLLSQPGMSRILRKKRIKNEEITAKLRAGIIDRDTLGRLGNMQRCGQALKDKKGKKPTKVQFSFLKEEGSDGRKS